MKSFNTIIVAFMLILFLAPISIAGDFDWMKDFSIKAEADSSGFKAELSTRFKIGGTEVNAVISNVDSPADAYMVLRLGEMSGQSTQYVLNRYKAGKGKGWGALAKSLGIKPGSKEFKALKSGYEFKDKTYTDKGKNKKSKNKKG